MIYDVISDFETVVTDNHNLAFHFFEDRRGIEDDLGNYVAVIYREDENDRQIIFAEQTNAADLLKGNVFMSVIFVLPELKFKDRDLVIRECCNTAAQLGNVEGVRLDSKGIYDSLYPGKEYRGDRTLIRVDVIVYVAIGTRKMGCICLADYC